MPTIRPIIPADNASPKEPKKIATMKGAARDLSFASFKIHDESHTLGNALRWMVMKNPNVEYCGYSAPHPSENCIQIRIQMYDKLSALDALDKALSDLDDLCLSIGEAYGNSLRQAGFERWEERS